MKMALEALETVTVDVKTTPNAYEASRQAITALRAAIEEAQEPVAWMTHSDDLMPLFHRTKEAALNWQTQPTPLYTAPQPREWVGLRGEQIYEVAKEIVPKTLGFIDVPEWVIPFARAIEAKLEEKNNDTKRNQ